MHCPGSLQRRCINTVISTAVSVVSSRELKELAHALEDPHYKRMDRERLGEINLEIGYSGVDYQLPNNYTCTSL